MIDEKYLLELKEKQIKLFNETEQQIQILSSQLLQIKGEIGLINHLLEELKYRKT